MDVGKVEGSELKKLVLLSKKKRLNFAFCPGMRDDHTIVIDKKKAPRILGTVAKSIGPGKKVAYGTFVLNQKTLELTCDRVLPKMAKDLQKYLKKQRILVNVLILDEAGNALEKEESDLPDEASLDEGVPSPNTEAATEPEQEASAAVVPETSELAKRIKALLPLITAMSEGNADKLNKATAQAISQIKAGDLTKAEQIISAIEGAIEKRSKVGEDAKKDGTGPQEGQSDPDMQDVIQSANNVRDAIRKIGGTAGEKLNKALGNVAKLIKAGDLMGADALLQRVSKAAENVAADSSAASSPAAENWTKASAKLKPIIEDLMRNGQGDLAGINRAYNFADEQAAAGNFDKAMAALAGLVDLIKQARTTSATKAAREAQDAVPDNVVAYTKTRLGWMSTRAGLRKELEDLKSAIDKATASVEGLEDVPTKSGRMLDHLDGIDAALEDTLDQLVNASDGDQRDSLKSTARQIIDQYRGALDSDFFQAVDSNGFAETNIRAMALNSLQEVSVALET